MANLINIQADDTSSIQGSNWLIYNGILLTDVLTEGYEVEEYQTADKSQKLGNHHVLKVMGIIDPQVNSWATPGGTIQRQAQPLNVMAGNINVLQSKLLEPRKVLKWGIGQTVVLESPAFRLAGQKIHQPCDNMQGPHPLYCQITKITGTTSFYVRFAIETWLDACVVADDVGANTYIQSHRYSQAHDVDGETWLTTRQTAGHIRFRPELLEKDDIVPDEVAFNLHPVPPGFQRHNVKVQVSTSGYELTYSFTDSERVMPLGSNSPSLRLQAEFSVASSVAEGKPANTIAAIHVSAIGPKNEYRYNLLRQALNVALQKLNKPGFMMMTDIQVTYSLDNTAIDLSMKAIWKSVGIGPAGLQLNQTGLLASDDYGDLDTALAEYRNPGEYKQGTQADRALSPDLPFGGRKGTWLGLAIGSTLVNGCFNNTDLNNYKLLTGQNGRIDVTTIPAGSGGDIDVPSVTNTGTPVSFSVQTVSPATIANQATGLSNDYVTSLGCFTEWSMDVSYRTMHNKAVMPVGVQQSASPGSTAYPAPQVATLGHPYTLKCVNWTVECIIPDPVAMVLPSPDTGDSNDVLLREDITPAVPTVGTSTNKAWRVSGTYWYLAKDIHTSSAQVRSQYSGTDPGFAVGKMFSDPSARAANTISQSRFVAGYSPSFVG